MSERRPLPRIDEETGKAVRRDRVETIVKAPWESPGVFVSFAAVDKRRVETAVLSFLYKRFAGFISGALPSPFLLHSSRRNLPRSSVTLAVRARAFEGYLIRLRSRRSAGSLSSRENTFPGSSSPPSSPSPTPTRNRERGSSRATLPSATPPSVPDGDENLLDKIRNYRGEGAGIGVPLTVNER